MLTCKDCLFFEPFKRRSRTSVEGAWIRMKRKRFVKLMMSIGLRRNDANRFANAIEPYHKNGVTYDFFRHVKSVDCYRTFFVAHFEKFEANIPIGFVVANEYRTFSFPIRIENMKFPPAISSETFVNGRNIDINAVTKMSSRQLMYKKNICGGQ